MNRAFMTPPEPTPAVAEPTKDQTPAISAFLQVADAMSAALASDNLEQFNTASAPAMDATGRLLEIIRKLPHAGGVTPETLEALDHARHFHGFPDLQAARAAFHRFSIAAVAALEPLRSAGQTPEFEIYECGMVDEALPGVAAKARWIQTGKRALANPFFGSDMRECGKRIHP
jgi:Cu(I)/Ag(I) efflux system membrane fusion protein